MNSPLPFVPTGCKNLSGMTAPVGYWVALLTVLCGLVYLGLKYRALRASAGDLSTALSRRETELLEARESLHRIAAIDPITSLANHSAFQEFLQAEWRRALRGPPASACYWSTSTISSTTTTGWGIKPATKAWPGLGARSRGLSSGPVTSWHATEVGSLRS